MGLIFVVGLLIWGWVEMSTFIYIGNKIGGLLTLLGVFVTAIIGIALLKNQGFYVLDRIRNDVRSGRTPVTSVADSISLVVGGLLMLLPGYLTDIIGFLLFIPGFRTVTGVFILKWITNGRKFTGFVNLGSGPFPHKTSEHPGMNNEQAPFGFTQKYRQQHDPEDVI